MRQSENNSTSRRIVLAVAVLSSFAAAARGVLCLTFDDPNWDRWAANIPLFAEYGAKCSFFPNGPLNDHALAQLKKLIDAGHTVGPHTLRHGDANAYLARTGSPEAFWRQEVQPQLDMFAKIGHRPKSMAYPNNRRNEATDEFLARKCGIVHFRSGRATRYDPKGLLRGALPPLSQRDDAFIPASELPSRTVMKGVGVGEAYGTDIDDLCRAVRRAAERDEALILFSHNIAPDAHGVNMKSEWLVKLLAAAKESGVAMLGFDDIPAPSHAPGARWMWYPGDFEVYHSGKVQERRLEWGGITPVMWPQYTPYPVVSFNKSFTLSEPETVDVWADGVGNCRVTGSPTIAFNAGHFRVRLPAGKVSLWFKLSNTAGLPALLVKGRTVVSDGTWLADWDSGSPVPAGTSPDFADPDVRPVDWKLPVRFIEPTACTNLPGGGIIADFGRETFAFPIFRGVKGPGRVRITYGESEKEALSDKADVWEVVDLPKSPGWRSPTSRAFRYICVRPLEPGVSVGGMAADFEWLPIQCKGSFTCDDPLVNRIWDVSVNTLHLSTREFFLDGLKRDRWLWSGDAYQSYLMNYYTFADAPSVTRTIWALRGKDPVVRHLNTIVDYSFYWFNSIADYHLYTGDDAFLRAVYPRMVTLMDFCLSRCRPDGMYERRPGDWMFVDWAPKPLANNGGPVAFEQILLVKALETMAECAAFAKDSVRAEAYRAKAAGLRSKILPAFYDEQRGLLVHALNKDGSRNAQITKYANIFALFHGYFSGEERDRVAAAGILDPNLMQIQTPYMRFYELEALCALGRQADVLREIRSYWGGMLEFGADTFWELYSPGEKGDEIYAMYGRPFGRSFCHAWGASPVYLLGRYFLGVAPTAPGFAKYTVRPAPGGLKKMEGSVPTPSGPIVVKCSEGSVSVTGNGGEGTLVFGGRSVPIPPRATVRLP